MDGREEKISEARNCHCQYISVDSCDWEKGEREYINKVSQVFGISPRWRETAARHIVTGRRMASSRFVGLALWWPLRSLVVLFHNDAGQAVTKDFIVGIVAVHRHGLTMKKRS